MFPGVLHVFYDCLIIPIVRTSSHVFKIVVSPFHTFIAATSGKIIQESSLEGLDLMIWGRSIADDSRTRLHAPPQPFSRGAMRLQARPIPSVIAPTRRSDAELSSAAQNVSIGPLTSYHAASEVLNLRFTRPRASTRSQFCRAACCHSSQPIISVAVPLRRSAAEDSSNIQKVSIGAFTHRSKSLDICSKYPRVPS